jgi:hypothetical protein
LSWSKLVLINMKWEMISLANSPAKKNCASYRNNSTWREIYLTECCIIFRFFTVFCPMEWPSAVKSRNISFSVHSRFQFYLGYSNPKFLPLIQNGRYQEYQINRCPCKLLVLLPSLSHRCDFPNLIFLMKIFVRKLQLTWF